MKSHMVTALDLVPETFEVDTAVRNGYSDLKVMQSAAGYYLGTSYEEYDAQGEIVWQEPGSRDGGYFASKAEAESSLRLLTALGQETSGMVMRQHP
jgi:hypothetical protein